MGLLDILKKKPKQINSTADFWNWFAENQKTFLNIIRGKSDVEHGFLDKVSPIIRGLHEDVFLLVGMLDSETAEVIFTADGFVKKIAIIEQLVKSAPYIKGWKFTALKPAMHIDDFVIDMQGYKFSKELLSFYANEIPGCPDEVDVVIVHGDFNEQNKNVVTNGCYIFLDHLLGELNFTTTIDNLSVVGKTGATKELIPIEKLNDYLLWRQKEFVEKYQGVKETDEYDKHSILEASLDNGETIVAVVNTELLQWDSKASHPWIVNILIKYDGSNNNGMPDGDTYELLNNIENVILEQLPATEGYLSVGRETGGNRRTIFIACKDFRKPSIILDQVERQHRNTVEISFEVFKDKYWRSLNKFVRN